MSDYTVELSIKVITYNHALYIKKALDSILMQKVDFKYEIVIGDDASTDGTQKILKQYKDKYPDKMKLILNKTNKGVVKNSCNINRYLCGKYVTLLEGDNYWIDENKLQAQFDFMESNPMYSACGHPFITVDENDNLLELPFTPNCLFQKNSFTIQDFLQEKLPGHSNSLFYVNIFKDPRFGPDLVSRFNSNVGDETTVLFLLLIGKIHCIPDKFMAWRFINKENATNWCSRINQNPYYHFEYFFYYVKLENYLRKVWKFKVSFLKHKKRRIFLFIKGIQDNIRNQFCNLLIMILYSNNIKTCAAYVINSIQYFKLREDIPDFIIEFHKNLVNYEKQHKDIMIRSLPVNITKGLKDEEIILYGAGDGASYFIKNNYLQFKIKYIVDNDLKKQGTSFMGLLVRSPEEIAMDSNIFITAPQYEEEIIRDLKNLKVKNIYSMAAMEWNRNRNKVCRLLDLEQEYA